LPKQTLNDYINLLQDEDLMVDFSDPSSVKHEIASILKTFDRKKAVHFSNVNGYETDIFGNLCCSREFIAKGFGISVDQIPEKIINSFKNPVTHKIVTDGSCQEVESTKIDLIRDLPILTHYQNDGGPYITSAVLIAREPETERLNASYHRMMVVGKDRFVARLVKGRDLDRFYNSSKELGESLNVAVVIGGPLPFLIACSTSPGELCELDVAGGLLGEPLEMVECKTNDLVVPRFAECILEGELLLEFEKEGPFVDVTGTYDIIRDQPLLKVNMITHKDDFFYHALMPAGNDHVLLMGMPKEAKIFSAVRTVSKVQNIVLSSSGSGWLAAAISIKKGHPYEPYVTAMAAVAAHSSLKRVIVVDEDVDITDPVAVDKAVLERAHVVDDYQVIKNIRGSSLDHSGIRVDGRVLSSAKLFIDATIKGEKKLFETAKFPQ
jgi:2,5-furandicarboxylate decarboxylase 1